MIFNTFNNTLQSPDGLEFAGNISCIVTVYVHYLSRKEKKSLYKVCR